MGVRCLRNFKTELINSKKQPFSMNLLWQEPKPPLFVVWHSLLKVKGRCHKCHPFLKTSLRQLNFLLICKCHIEKLLTCTLKRQIILNLRGQTACSTSSWRSCSKFSNIWFCVLQMMNWRRSWKKSEMKTKSCRQNLVHWWQNLIVWRRMCWISRPLTSSRRPR